MIAWTRGRIVMLGAALALAAPLCAPPAEASRVSRSHGYSYSGRSAARVIAAGAFHYSRYRGGYNPARYGYAGGLQCVPFARENTGIELAGNAANWWENAAGVYERGERPEVGSVLNFRATGRMHMGHVAVVSNVINSRNVQIDHANWSGRGVVTRNVTVVDISPANDWSAVRVALGNGDFGSIYPTYGFIYDRPDKGTMVANNAAARTPMPMLAAPRDLRPAADRVLIGLGPQQEEEVAEAADDMPAPQGRSLRAARYSRHQGSPRGMRVASSRYERDVERAGSRIRGGHVLMGRMMVGHAVPSQPVARRGESMVRLASTHPGHHADASPRRKGRRT